MSALTQHERQWADRGFYSYAFDLDEQQFGREYNLHVTVHTDTVADIVDLATGVAPEFAVSAPTIDALFAQADAALREKGTTVTLEFNSQFGYPTLFAASNNNPGGPYLARVSNLQPTQ